MKTAAQSFDETVREETGATLCGVDLSTIQVNVGLRCNLACTHCHLDASPRRTEVMPWEVMSSVVDLARATGCHQVAITGGAPELNPDLRRFITALHDQGTRIQVRTNLTVLLEPGMEAFPGFFRDHQVQLVASLPCYLEQNVAAQRGTGAYQGSVVAIRRLNALGYGTRPGLELDLVYNPGGPFLPPAQSSLEADYKRELDQRFGVRFNNLLTIINMPLGRFGSTLRRQHKEQAYLDLLRTSFNGSTVAGLMCRHQVSVGWDGRLYDCDFNLALGLPVHPCAGDLETMDLCALSTRRIVTDTHCFGCTAGCGSSCGGALDDPRLDPQHRNQLQLR